MHEKLFFLNRRLPMQEEALILDWLRDPEFGTLFEWGRDLPWHQIPRSLSDAMRCALLFILGILIFQYGISSSPAKAYVEEASLMDLLMGKICSPKAYWSLASKPDSAGRAVLMTQVKGKEIFLDIPPHKCWLTWGEASKTSDSFWTYFFYVLYAHDLLVSVLDSWGK